MNIYITILIEFLLVATFVLGIYKLKKYVGLVPLYVFLGLIQFLQTILLYFNQIKITDNISLSPGSIILFSASLFTILLIYIKEGVIRAQSIILSIILSNVIFVIIAEVTILQSNPVEFFMAKVNAEVFRINYKTFIVGTVVLLIDAFLLVILYEFINSKMKRINLYFKITIVLLVTLWVDSFLFVGISFYNKINLYYLLQGQLIGKTIAAIIFSTALYIYLKYFDKVESLQLKKNKNDGILSILDYRYKYQQLLTEKEKSEENFLKILQQKNNELEKTVYQLQALSSIKELPIDISLNTQMEHYLKKITTIFNVEGCILRLIEKDKLILSASVGINKKLLNATIPYDTKHSQRVFAERITYLQNTDLDENEEEYRKINQINYHYKTYVGVPISSDKVHYGILGLYTHTYNKVFTQLELEHILIIGNQLAQIIQNIKLFEQNEKHKEILIKQIIAKREVDNKIKESEQYLKTILESEPECIKIVDKNGYLLDMNPAGLQMIEADNVEMVKGKSIINIIDEQYRTAFNKLNNNVFKGNSGKLEFEITGLKGTKRWLETHAAPFKNTNGEITALLGVTRDITNKKKSEIDLKESEEKYRLLFKSNPLPVWIVDKETHSFLDVNDAALKLYEYTKEEILSLKATQIRPKDEVEEYIKSMNDNSIVIRTSGPWTHIKKNGEIIKVEITAENILYDNILCNLVVINNITEKLKTQKLLEDTTKQLRELASYLQNIREEERKDIAREIHDELGQQLTSLKIDVSWLKKNILKDDNKYDNKFSEILLLIDSTIKSVRQISTKIRPSTLDDLGLTAAVEWLLQDFTTRMKISIFFKNDFNDKEINSIISIGLYRIIQESLNNIAKHSKASNVLINIKRVNHHIHLSIKDDGVGFDTTAKRKEKNFGLLGIKERSIIMQGTYEIFSEPNKGTEVVVKIPI